jgi:hypothetical protein
MAVVDNRLMWFDVGVRYSVDPAELQTAAGRMGEAADAALRARERLLDAAQAVHSWVPVEYRRSVQEALDALAFSALKAQVASQRTAARLVHAAEGYAAADGQAAQ